MRKVVMLAVLISGVLSAQSQFTKATLQATGLTCAMCSNAINKALLKVSFVESVKSDIKNSAFNIVFKAGSTVEADVLKNAVEDAGFSVGSLKMTGMFNNLKIANNQHIQVAGQTFLFLNTGDKVLNGEVVLVIVDKNFITEKRYKKIAASSKLACMQTGIAGDCCTKAGVAAGTRVYHVTM